VIAALPFTPLDAHFVLDDVACFLPILFWPLAFDRAFVMVTAAFRRVFPKGNPETFVAALPADFLLLCNCTAIGFIMLAFIHS